MTRCSRCGDFFVAAYRDEPHCLRCRREVAALVRADRERRLVRRWPAKDLTAA